MGQTDVALSEVRELLAKAGDNLDVLTLAGEVHLAAGDGAGAARHYERARALDPDSARLQTRLAQIRFATGDAEKGFAELESASASHPGDHQAEQRRHAEQPFSAACPNIDRQCSIQGCGAWQ